MTPQSRARLAVVLVLLLAVVLGGPLLWGFAVSALGVLVWLGASFGFLPGDWFATNLATLSTVGIVIAVPALAVVVYRLAFRVYRVEYALITGTASGSQSVAVSKSP